MSNHFDNFQMPNNTNDNTFSFSSFGTFGSTSNDLVSNGGGNVSNNSGVLVKETGIIEKMLISYGFIQCCERQARLFFHFSQFIGNTNHLKIGDPVEYEMSYDKRTGKPVAINIRKIMSCDFMDKMKTTERLSGVIATEVQNGREGRVAFENMGEFFFLPFTQNEVSGNVVLKAQDHVSFIIISDDGGNYRAKDIEIEQSSYPSKGIVLSIKDTFGFIDCHGRPDGTSSKIFFHSSDCRNFHQLEVGDHVEFMVSTRKNKELATNIVKLSNVAEQVTDAFYQGLVIKYNGRSNPGSGLLKYIEQDKDFIFYDKDVSGTFTLCDMDMVTFQFIIDQHSKSMRPTNIQLNLNTFKMNREERLRGYIASLKDIYGFIKCPSKEGTLIYFKLTEFITDTGTAPKLNDEVEFTFVSDEMTKKCQAIRILYLPNGTLFSNLSKKAAVLNNHEPMQERSFSDIIGHAQKELFNNLGINMNHGLNGMEHFFTNGHGEPQRKAITTLISGGGDIGNNINNTNVTSNAWNSNGIEALSFNLKKMDLMSKLCPAPPEEIMTPQMAPLAPATNGHGLEMKAMNGFGGGGSAAAAVGGGGVVVEEANKVIHTNNSINNNNLTLVGIVVSIKDGYGFIESLDGEKDYFFHNTSFLDGTAELGQTVEFTPELVKGKWKANEIRVNANIVPYEMLPNSDEQHIGIVMRTAQMFNTDQTEYTGYISPITNIEAQDIDAAVNFAEKYEFSLLSLKFVNDYISIGDCVNYRVARNPITKKLRAYQIEVVRPRLKGVVNVLNRYYGFVKPEGVENNAKSVYFSKSEYPGFGQLKYGDLIEFFLVDNKTSGKMYAIDIKLLQSSNNTTDQELSSSPLKSFMREPREQAARAKVVVIRQPRAPDGTNGFNVQY